MKRKIMWVAWAVLVTAVVMCLLVAWLPKPGGDGSTHTGPTLEKIQELTVLVAQRVTVSDIVETRINGRTGGIRAVVLVQGDVLVGVDLQQARIVSRDDGGRRLVVELPGPAVSSPRVDHAHTQIYSIDQWGLWCLVPGGGGQAAVADRAFRDAQGAVARAGADSAIMVQAKDRTQRIIASFGRALGWDIELRWREF